MSATFLIDAAPFFLNGVAGSASGSITVPGFTELGTGTATAFVLSGAPYVGALLGVYQSGTATGGKSIVTNATTVTIDAAGDRTVTFNGEGDSILMIGTSTTRWQIITVSGSPAFS